MFYFAFIIQIYIARSICRFAARAMADYNNVDNIAKEVLYLHKRIIAALLCAFMLTGTAVCFSGCDGNKTEQKPVSTDFKTAGNVADGAILQAFSWDFNTIKASIPDIAAAGFSAVQTSPVNECLKGDGGGMELYGDGKWYYHYQPTDFKIGNYQLGTRDEFKEMCAEAHKYGVKVIVDVIANHTTTTLSEVSQNLIKAGGGSLETLFHKGNSNDISDYSDRLQCTTYKMGGLPDINTERPSYQDYFINFLNDCIACGADGFRHDTAKHIGLPDDPKENDGFKNNFWERVTKEIDNADKMFIYGEVLQGGNDRIDDYVKAIGRTTSSVYGSKIRSALVNNFIDTASVSEYWIEDPSHIVTWVESHDNYINDGTWAQLSDDRVIAGWAIIASRKDGTPLFFSRPYGSSIEDEWGMNRIGAQGSDEYKDSRVKAVNFFRTAMKGEDEKLVNPGNKETALMIERGKKGAVIVNIDTQELKTGFEINLPDGEYTDRVDEKTVYTVKDGKLTSEKGINANSVVVLYNEGYEQYAKCANVGVAKGTKFLTEGDSVKVTLTAENAKNAEYRLDGEEAVSFRDGDAVTVKAPKSGGVVKLELTAENEQGVETYERVEFTFRKNYTVGKGAKVYFEKPSNWGDKIYAYVYNVDEDENDSWPGEEMKKESGGKYSYTLTDEWKSPMIIFNDGDAENSVQYPEAGAKGFEVEDGKTYKVK
ncbi:MAG TPA: hypothetical protein DEO32_05180 [Ruminococcaceae bacterium]|nr:hypothetical protein [Oscillospiraceae bacterium]